jgi:hypothetical protein
MAMDKRAIAQEKDRVGADPFIAEILSNGMRRLGHGVDRQR